MIPQSNQSQTPKRPGRFSNTRGSQNPHRTGFSGQRRRGGPGHNRRPAPHFDARKAPEPGEVSISQAPANTIRIIPLGGFEEVGRNMMVIEYGNDRIIIDVGLKFPEEDTPGIDYIIPNIAYLHGKERSIRGIFITHGHYDHMGAIPYLMQTLGNPPIFTTPLTRGMIMKRQDDFPHAPKLEIHQLTKQDPKPVVLGPFTVEYFHVNHNIPDSIGLAIHTPIGTLVHSCDFKFDFNPIGDEPADLNRIAAIGSKGVLALLSDSTGAEHPGHSLSEGTIMENLDQVFQKAQGRVIMATFASLIGRIQQGFLLAEKYGRKVAIDGYSMKANIEVAQGLGYLKIPKGMIVDIRDVEKMDPQRVAVFCTGAQGESKAVLMRIANREHRFVQIHPNDTVIFSSSIVPGNERAVQYLKDSLMRAGAKVFHYKMMDIHASGHAYAEDLKLMMALTKPKFLVPIHGQYSMLKTHAELGESVGMAPTQIAVGFNGAIIEVTQNTISVLKEKVPGGYVFVDGLGIGDVKEVVLRDRQQMAADGMFVVVAVVDTRAGKVKGEPDIISRGFVYMRESQELLDVARGRVKEKVEAHFHNGNPMNIAHLRDSIREDLGRIFFLKTQRRPMVLPVIIEV